jgi:HEAT repeat protein
MITRDLIQQLTVEPAAQAPKAGEWQPRSQQLSDRPLAVLIDRLGSANEAEAVLSAMALIARGAAAVPALLAALGHPTNIWLRRRAIWPLHSIGDPRAIEPLIAALRHDPDAKVRRYAAWALGMMGDARSITPLIAAFADPDERVRWDAAVALEKIGAPAVEPLVMALYYGAPAVRIGAIRALAWMRDPETVPVLLRALADPSVEVRTQAAFALGWVGDRRAVEPLIACLNDADDSLRMQAALALGWIGDPQAIEPLVRLLGETGSWVPVAAVEALSHIRDPHAYDALALACGLGHAGVRSCARRALILRGIDPDSVTVRYPWMFRKRPAAQAAG